MASRRIGPRLAMMPLALFALGAAACSAGGSDQSGSQTEEQVLEQYRAHPSDLAVTTTVTVTSGTTRTAHVHVENTGIGGDVDDVRLHLTLQGEAHVVLPLPEVPRMEANACSGDGPIECVMGWLNHPTGDQEYRPSFVDLEFRFEVGNSDGTARPTVTISVDCSIGGGYEERDIDETPENNTVTVEL